MALIKDGRMVPDAWVTVADNAPLPDGPAIVSLERWRAAGAALTAGGRPVGVVLRSDQTPDQIAGSLDVFDAVAMEFPVFTDGRAYSSARLLRDQLLFMQRVGFDAFEVPASPGDDWLDAFAEFDVVYQAGADTRVPVPHLRHSAAVDRVYWTAG